VRTCQDGTVGHRLSDGRVGGCAVARLVETGLYRIVQEALTNVVQHAGASGVSLLLAARRTEPRAVVLVVEDNGCGFEVTG